MADYLTNLFNLQGRVAALTGAGGHIVGELSKGLAKAGVKVAVLDFRLANAQRIANEIVSEGGAAVAFEVDVRRKESIQAGLDGILETFGDLHYCVNGAGINAPTPFLEIDQAGWDDVFSSQLTGTLFGLQVFGKHMVGKGFGSIINISSASAGPPLSKAFAYSAAKAAIVNLTQNVAREWAPCGVRVNAIRPGFFPTEWNRKNFITPEREQAILGHTPMGRYGHPAELVGAALWLFSDAASFVTGAEIAVDGGYSAMTI
jgi:NAD(P)-dependent dehydrogenase (short-subunit alcohol dehydrogenase family)